MSNEYYGPYLIKYKQTKLNIDWYDRLGSFNISQI